VQQYAAVAGLKAAVGRDPGIEQPGGFEGSFEAGAFRGGDGIPKIHEMPERRAVARLSDIWTARIGDRRRRIDARFEAPALVLKRTDLLVQNPASGIERGAALRQPLGGALLCRVQDPPSRIVAIHRDDPVGQRDKRRGALVGTNRELLQPGEVALPVADKRLAFCFHFGVGLCAPFARFVRIKLPIVPDSLFLCVRSLRPIQFVSAPPQERDLFAPLRYQGVHAGAAAIEIARDQFDQPRRVQCNKRILAMRSADPRASRVDRRLPPHRG